MTATRDRRSDPDEDAETAWDDRPILGTSRGLPWWGGVLLAFGLTAIAAVVDMQRQGSLGRIYQGVYLLGCVGAVCWVRRRSLFGPIVQPPLVFAVTAITAVVALGDEPSTGIRQLVFSVALKLTSNFPTMAIATGVTVAIGLYRLWRERDPNPPVRLNTQTDRPARGSDSTPRDRYNKGRPPATTSSRKSSRGREPEDPDNRRATPRGRPPRDRGSRRDPTARDRGTDRRDRDPAPPDRTTGDRPARGSRSRPRDQDSPQRRRDPDARPRRDDNPTPARRNLRDRGTPRRRPPDPYN